MGIGAVHAMTGRVAELMETKLGIRGKGLEAKLRRGGRLLPRQVRAAAQSLVTAEGMIRNPRLAMQVDNGQLAANFDACLKHLNGLPAASGWGGLALQSLRAIAFGVLSVAVALIAYLVWRGYI
jgi:hypothetical protein